MFGLYLFSKGPLDVSTYLGYHNWSNNHLVVKKKSCSGTKWFRQHIVTGSKCFVWLHKDFRYLHCSRDFFGHQNRGILCTLFFVLQNTFIAISIWSIVLQEALLIWKPTRCSFIVRMANVLLLFEDLMAKRILNMNMTILFEVAKNLNKTTGMLFIA